MSNRIKARVKGFKLLFRNVKSLITLEFLDNLNSQIRSYGAGRVESPERG